MKKVPKLTTLDVILAFSPIPYIGEKKFHKLENYCNNEKYTGMSVQAAQKEAWKETIMTRISIYTSYGLLGITYMLL